MVRGIVGPRYCDQRPARRLFRLLVQARLLSAFGKLLARLGERRGPMFLLEPGVFFARAFEQGARLGDGVVR